jgi:mono/diheme cytochrome c family protein
LKAEATIQICSRCHAVLRGEGLNPNPDPIAFRTDWEAAAVRRRRQYAGITEAALYAWLTTMHPTMPNNVLGKEDLRNVVAYILGLKRDQP